MSWKIDLAKPLYYPHVLRADRIKKKNLVKKGVGDRANDKDKSVNISFLGTAAEFGFGVKLQNHYPSICHLWLDKLRLGIPDYGADYIIPGWLKPFEVKYTENPLSPSVSLVSGVLFMRCINGHAKEGQGLHEDESREKHGCKGHRSYWERYLPDSFYVLMHQIDPQNNPLLFKFNGWCVRDKFFEFQDEHDCWNRVINKKNQKEKGHDGYPTICLHHEHLNKNWDELIEAAKPAYAITP